MTGTGTPPPLEHKSAATLDARPGPAGAAATVDPDTGEVVGLAAVTGSRDEVGDVIVPGAISRALRRRTPRLVAAHDWARVAGRITEAEELMPGDPRLPDTAPDGTPWPREAGALWFRAVFLPTTEGKNARAVAHAFQNEQAYSVGYRVTDRGAQHKGGTRYIRDLDIYEVSAVLHGANRLARQLSVKHAAPAGREVKAASSALRNLLGGTACGACGRIAAGASDPLPTGTALLCAECVQEVDQLSAFLADDSAAATDDSDGEGGPIVTEHVPCGLCARAVGVIGGLTPDKEIICGQCLQEVGTLADRLGDDASGEREPTDEQLYADALRDEKPLTALPDGTLVRDRPAERGHGWAPGAGGRARP